MTAVAGRGRIGCLLVLLLGCLGLLALGLALRGPVPASGQPRMEEVLARLPPPPEDALPPEVEARLIREIEAETDRLVRLEARLRLEKPAPPAVPPSPAVAASTGEVEDLLADRPDDLAALRQAWLDFRGPWRQVVEDSIRLLERGDEGAARELAVPPFHSFLYGRLRGTPEAEAYRAAYARLEDLARRLLGRSESGARTELEAWREEVGAVYAVRSALLARLAALGYQPLLDSGSGWGEDAVLELETIPYKFLWIYRLRDLEYRRAVRSGYLGLTFLVGEALLLLLAVVLPLLLAGVQVAVVRGMRAREPALRARGWWAAALASAIPWLVAVALLAAEHRLLRETALQELSLFLRWAAAWALYRALLAAGEAALPEVARRLPGDAPERTLARGRSTLRAFAAFLLIRGVTLATLEATVPGGLLELGVRRLFLIAGILLYVLLCQAWKREALAGLERRVAGRLGGALESPLAGLVLMPLLVPALLLLAGLTGLVRWSLRFEWGKRLAAGILRRWAQAVSKPDPGRRPVPEAYATAFWSARVPAEVLWGSPASAAWGPIRTPLDAWLEGGSARPLALVGEPGSGRTALLEGLAAHYGDRVRVLQVGLPPRILGRNDLAQVLARGLGAGGARSLEEVARHVLAGPRTLLLLDGMHHLFLAVVGGFEACREGLRFAGLVEGRVQVVWTVDRYAYGYLARVFEGDVSLPRRLPMPSVSDEQLRRATLERHAATGWSYRFDRALFQAGENARHEGLAEHFFEILWEQSGGLPSVAMDLWVRSLTVDPESPGGVLVGLPPPLSQRPLALASEDEMFLLASLMRHGTLTAREAGAVTGLGEENARFSLERLEDEGLLHREGSERYRVSRRWFVDVVRTLRRKNLLHGR